MTRPDIFDAEIGAWLDDEAQPPVPAAARDRALAAIATRRTRPGRLARLGSHWVGQPPRVSAPFGTQRLALPVLGSTSSILLLAMLLALLGAAMFVGSRLLTVPRDPGRLVYERAGDIYLANPDGSNPVQVVAPGGLVEGDAGGGYALVMPSIWAPDGSHFLFLEGGAESKAHISDADGRVVASFANLPGFNGYPVWSPDSTRLQSWTPDWKRISIHGIDGALQATLTLPAGYTRSRENLGVWGPDGRSVWVLIANASDDREAWELPIDGSPPRRVAKDIAFITFDLGFSVDRTRLAFSGRSGDPDEWLLNLANADGTGVRPAVRAADDANDGVGMVPVWSPSGRQVAYFVWASEAQSDVDLRVADIATGTARTLVAGFSYTAWPAYSWSPGGESILLSMNPALGAPGLWTVATADGQADLLVEAVTAGQWRPQPTAP